MGWRSRRSSPGEGPVIVLRKSDDTHFVDIEEALDELIDKRVKEALGAADDRRKLREMLRRHMKENTS